MAVQGWTAPRAAACPGCPAARAGPGGRRGQQDAAAADRIRPLENRPQPSRRIDYPACVPHVVLQQEPVAVGVVDAGGTAAFTRSRGGVSCSASSPHATARSGTTTRRPDSTGGSQADCRRADDVVERSRPADTAPYIPSLEQIVAEADRQGRPRQPPRFCSPTRRAASAKEGRNALDAPFVGKTAPACARRGQRRGLRRARRAKRRRVAAELTAPQPTPWTAWPSTRSMSI